MLRIQRDELPRAMAAADGLVVHAGFPERKAMTCAEFQEVLPYVIDEGSSEEERQHLAACEVCTDLVADLHFIAESAKLLVPMEDPSPRVWEAIQRSLTNEGLAKPAGNGLAR